MINQYFELGKRKAEEEINTSLTRANKQITSFLINRDLWREFRLQCVTDGISASRTLGGLITEYLERSKVGCES